LSGENGVFEIGNLSSNLVVLSRLAIIPFCLRSVKELEGKQGRHDEAKVGGGGESGKGYKAAENRGWQKGKRTGGTSRGTT
jgi:hypothetical protein